MRVALYTCALVTAAACGSDEHFIDGGPDVDASQVDADTTAPDAEPDEPDAMPPAPVQVTTYAYSDGALQADVNVLAFALDGTLRDRATTDANGEAELDVLSGDTVTAVYNNGSEAYLTTYLAVEPGDHLRFGSLAEPTPTGDPNTTMTVTWPAVGKSTTSVQLYTDCVQHSPAVSATSQAIIHNTDECPSATISALLIGYDSSGNITEWTSASSQPFVDQATLALPALQAPGTFAVNLTGMSPEIDDYYEINVRALVGGVAPVAGYPYWVAGTPQDGAMSGTIPWTDDVDGVIVNEYLYRHGNYGSQLAQRRLPADTASITAAITPLPWLADAVIALAAARTVQWFVVGDEPYDLQIIDLYWSTDTGGGKLAHGALPTSFYWRIHAPPGVSMLVWPELPEDLAMFAPASSAELDAHVSIQDSTNVADYDAVRALPEWDADCLGCVPFGAEAFPTRRYSDSNSGGKGRLIGDVRRRVRAPAAGGALR